jgi:hypothetical protein
VWYSELVEPSEPPVELISAVDCPTQMVKPDAAFVERRLRAGIVAFETHDDAGVSLHQIRNVVAAFVVPSSEELDHAEQLGVPGLARREIGDAQVNVREARDLWVWHADSPSSLRFRVSAER